MAGRATHGKEANADGRRLLDDDFHHIVEEFSPAEDAEHRRHPSFFHHHRHGPDVIGPFIENPRKDVLHILGVHIVDIGF